MAKKRSKNHLPLGPSISDPVPILQPPTASVSDYARRIELLAQDLSNGSALTKNNNNNPRYVKYALPSTVRNVLINS